MAVLLSLPMGQGLVVSGAATSISTGIGTAPVMFIENVGQFNRSLR